MPSWIKWRLRRAGFHLLQSLAAACARRSPQTLRTAADRLGALHFRCGGRKRTRLLQQMSRVLERPAGDPALRQGLEHAYRVSDRAIIEVIALHSGALSPQQLADCTRVSGLGPLRAALARGRGAILLGMHMGNGIGFAVALATWGLPVSVVYRESRKMPPGFFRRALERAGVEAISARPTLAGYRAMVRAVQRGRAVFVLMDQASKQGGVPVCFLGKRLPMPPGPAELARRTGVDVFPVLAHAAEPNWQFELGAAVQLCEDVPIEQDVARLVAIMDLHIRENPHLWSWHHRRWWRYPFPAGSGEGAAA